MKSVPWAFLSPWRIKTWCQVLALSNFVASAYPLFSNRQGQNRLQRWIAIGAIIRKRGLDVNLWSDPGAIVIRPGTLPINIRHVGRHFAIGQRKEDFVTDEVGAGAGRLADKGRICKPLEVRSAILRGGIHSAPNNNEKLSSLIHLRVGDEILQQCRNQKGVAAIVPPHIDHELIHLVLINELR